MCALGLDSVEVCIFRSTFKWLKMGVPGGLRGRDYAKNVRKKVLNNDLFRFFRAYGAQEHPQNRVLMFFLLLPLLAKRVISMT